MKLTKRKERNENTTAVNAAVALCSVTQVTAANATVACSYIYCEHCGSTEVVTPGTLVAAIVDVAPGTNNTFAAVELVPLLHLVQPEIVVVVVEVVELV
ncbi:Hypothetical predicted protein [Octopus vulgaris]|uniref:Uncharacterized protein n=1 Tax=Octopus vulgaris TaxID=6645 RepID=A0AA36BJR0_OCTVU|nr:Hypothetical predicted protein [Octopus vulgaris]